MVNHQGNQFRLKVIPFCSFVLTSFKMDSSHSSMKIHLCAAEAQDNSRNSLQGVLPLVLGFKEAFFRLWLYSQFLRALWKYLPIPWLHGLPAEDDHLWNWTSSQVCGKNRLQKWWITTKHCCTILHLCCSAIFWVAIQPSANWPHHTLLWDAEIHCRPTGWSVSPEPFRMGLAAFQVLLLFTSIKCTKAGSPSCHPPPDCLSLIAILWPEIVSEQKDVSAPPAFKETSLCQGGQDF